MVTTLEFGPLPTPICPNCKQYLVFTLPEEITYATDSDKEEYLVKCPECNKIVRFSDSYGISIPKAFKEKIQ